MQEVIKPIDRDILKAELTKEKMLRTTNKSQNEIYIVTAFDSPNVMREIGRLREIAFREYGGGTGNEVDIDEFDTMEDAYRQLIVWSPEDEQIMGGYRFLCGSDVRFDAEGKPLLATAHLFHFSDEFVKDYLPYTVELGRSFVTLEYQATREGSKKGLFILDNLWDGLGALSVVDPTLKYYFGKVTMYNTYDTESRNMILYFLGLHFPDPERLITPVSPLQTETDINKMKELFHHDNFKDNYKILNQEVRKRGINVPPLVNAYMSLSPKMRVFGTAVNHEFGEVEETGILIAIDEILEDKKKRHVESYLEEEYKSTELIRKI
ncbi:GNAT family N-acetyltransferase [Parabacteroides sp. OttesenSCG-928-B22]|uniref:GNAT family N-acetyltransferase n=1 Tax=unclassified Parabacteroides TaxID=2649774 RepID=UPI0024766629|nr:MULTISPECIES: GNAT family N-acetyltransferase [unclassified Parabacteroides]MDL2310107.1 GNAT family N-acetyltransferase [Parabacteroides sp. OttesenSCG-928-B22]